MAKNKPFTRMCIACRKRFLQDVLIRVTKNKAGEVLLRKGNGRSCYVCKDCKEQVLKKKLLNRALKMQVPENIYEELKMS